MIPQKARNLAASHQRRSKFDLRAGDTLVQGRTIVFFYFKNLRGGYNRHLPDLLVIALVHLYEVRQYQIVQTTLNQSTSSYVTQIVDPDIETKLTHTLKETLASEA